MAYYWSSDKLRFLKENPQLDSYYLANRLECSVFAVEKKLKELNLVWDKELDSLLIRYIPRNPTFNVFTIAHLADKLNKPFWMVKNRIDELCEERKLTAIPPKQLKLKTYLGVSNGRNFN